MVLVREIDLMHMGVPGAISAWLVSGDNGHVLIESGPASTLDALRRGLAAHDLRIADLSGVLLTHIHLDHAGGAWALAKEGVPVHVHHVGAPHLIDPEKLNRSARRIFEDRFDTLWGALEPCPEGLVHPAHDGDVVHVAGLTFEAIETRGHADHHHAWHLRSAPDMCFVGDAAAMRVPGTSWITIPMPPPEFDLDRWLATLNRLGTGPWTRLYLTHGGIVTDVPDHLGRLEASLNAQVQWLLSTTDMPRDARREAYCQWLEADARPYAVAPALFHTHVSRGLLDMNMSGVDRGAARA